MKVLFSVSVRTLAWRPSTMTSQPSPSKTQHEVSPPCELILTVVWHSARPSHVRLSNVCWIWKLASGQDLRRPAAHLASPPAVSRCATWRPAWGRGSGSAVPGRRPPTWWSWRSGDTWRDCWQKDEEAEVDTLRMLWFNCNWLRDLT